MTQKLYPTPGDFLRDNRGFFEGSPAAGQLNQCNALARQGEPCSPELLFGRYEQAGRTVLLFGNTAPWCLCLNAPGEMDALAAQAAAELAGWLKEQKVPIAGVSGRDWLCQRFMEAYGGGFVPRSAMDIMVLTRLTEPPAVPGVVRPAEEKDLELLVRWVCAFYQEALNEEADPEAVRQRSRERVRRGEVRVLESPQGELLSMAHTSREMERGISISGVYTPPEHRGKGCCQATVGSLCRELLAGGKDYCSLFVDKRNPISNRVYRKIGFEVLEDCSEYRLASL